MQTDFLTYNQQMKYLRVDKKIKCSGAKDKSLLVTTGYFNLINGYKNPFVVGQSPEGKHIYRRGTTIDEFYALKTFDDNLRMCFLKYLIKIEEELRSLAAYTFDFCNNQGKIPWYKIEAYDTNLDIQKVVKVISDSYSQINRSCQEYVKHFLENHNSIPTWILVKTIKFSTFIDFINYSKSDVSHSLCNLYDMTDQEGKLDKKLLIGSLHWIRQVRNSCAHNERIYAMKRNGRIVSPYFDLMHRNYNREREQKIVDLIVFFKYYLPHKEFEYLVEEVKDLLKILGKSINSQAFEQVRADMGIKQICHLDSLLLNPKEIMYNKHT